MCRRRSGSRLSSKMRRRENFGYKRDLGSLTRWQWSVPVTGDRPTDQSIRPTHRSVLHPLLSRRLQAYAHVVNVPTIYRLSRSLLPRESPRRVTRKICFLYGGKLYVRELATGCTVRDRNSARLRRDSYARR